ncbi:antitermination protein N [Enterobacter sp. TMH.L2]
MDSQARRRERREAKQAEWKAANPLLVGVSAKPQRQVLTLNRKAMPRPEKATQTVNEYGVQILNAIELHEALRSQADKHNQRIWHNKPTREMGITCSGRQKMKGKSIPLI